MFEFLYDCVRAMLNQAGFNKLTRVLMWAECANVAVYMDNIHVRYSQASSYELFYGKKLKLTGLGAFGAVSYTHLTLPTKA